MVEHALGCIHEISAEFHVVDELDETQEFAGEIGGIEMPVVYSIAFE